jgi:2-amino-4-hydroxy-6-hydroxymethyldihydropteridine diphosphokinase
MKPAYLSLGSNLGDRQWLLAEAVRRLAADPAIAIVRGSSVYETSPVGVTTQPKFLNLVVEIATRHEPLALLDACLGVEASLGRERRERWGPRTIDIDVLLFDSIDWSDDHLTLPHPRLHERSFVLEPLAELAPALEVKGVGIAELAARIGSAGIQRIATWTDLAQAAGLAPATIPRTP